MANKIKSISIIIPARNEEETIGDVLSEINKTLADLKGIKKEVIVIDDGSNDQTFKIAKRYVKNVFINNGEHGKGNALKLGFKKAEGDAIIMMDADYSHIASDIPKFLKKMDEGYTLVIGSRAFGGSEEYGIIRGFGNWMLSFAFRIIFGIKIMDALNGYKAFLRNVAKNYEYKSKNYEIEIELISNALKEGGDIIEIPSYERKRGGGIIKSHALKDGPRFLFAIIKHGIRYRLSKKP